MKDRDQAGRSVFPGVLAIGDVAATNPEPKCRVFLLGSFRLEIAGREVTTENWKSRRALALLKILLANQGESVSRAFLLERFWTNQPEEKSLRTLNTTIYYLRRALQPYSDGEELIRHKDGRYRFHTDHGCWYDVNEFEERFQQALACESTDRALALQHFTQVVGLYRGDYLPEELYEDWTSLQRERYREIYLQSLLQATALLAESGDLAGALRLCKLVLKEDPLRGDAHEYQIHLLFASGRVSEAVQQYKEYRRILNEELDIAPSLDLEQMLHGLGLRQTLAAAIPRQREAIRLKICNRSMFDAIITVRNEYPRLVKEASTILELTFTRALNEATREVLLSTLEANLRSNDIVCCADDRLVFILLSHTNAKAAECVKDRLHRTIEEAHISLRAIEVMLLESYLPEEFKESGELG